MLVCELGDKIRVMVLENYFLISKPRVTDVIQSLSCVHFGHDNVQGTILKKSGIS
jgi:hypothetical protein